MQMNFIQHYDKVNCFCPSYPLTHSKPIRKMVMYGPVPEGTGLSSPILYYEQYCYTYEFCSLVFLSDTLHSVLSEPTRSISILIPLLASVVCNKLHVLH